MVALFALITALCIGRTAGQQDPRCGQTFFTDSTGWFTSPLYPSNYPDNIQCEWLIQTAPRTIIEIEFEDFRVLHSVSDESSERTDYVLIFDTDNNSTTTYPNYWSYQEYLSYSNSVTVRFVSDDTKNFVGFNLTYRSRDANLCDKTSLEYDNKINLERTRCRGKTVANNVKYHRRCFVKCNNHYALISSSKVTCQNGRFQPEDPCSLIEWEVQLCDKTNMLHCHYNTPELLDYWNKNNDWKNNNEEDSSEFEEFNLDLFPGPEDVESPTQDDSNNTSFAQEIETSEETDDSDSTSEIVWPPTLLLTSSRGIETKCFDDLLGYSYCVRRKDNSGDYAFSCKAFLKIKKLDEKSAENKMDACFQCRGIDCTSVVYV